MASAYDYTAQKWVEGEAAKVLLRQQLTEDLELLEGPEGDGYAAFIALDKNEAIQRTRAGIAALA